MKFAKLGPIATALALALVLVGCGNGAPSSFHQNRLTDASGIRVEAQNAGPDMEATTEAAFTIKDGEVILISPDVDEGSFHVTIAQTGSNKIVFDEDVNGKMLFTIEVDHGTYDITTRGNRVTGALVIAAQNERAFVQQNEGLESILETEGTPSVENTES